MTAEKLLTRGEGVALWRQIARQIEHDIRAQVLRPGDKLPTEWELTARFGVNRHTVRRALSALAEEGVVRAEQGRGTFVQEGLIDYHITRRTRFSDTIRAQDREPEGVLISSSEDRADTRIASLLRIPVGSITIAIEALRRADGHAVSVATHIFPKERFPHILEAYRDLGSITKALSVAGIGDYTRSLTRVSARLPSPEETRILQVPKTRPLLVTESVDVDSEGVPIEFGIARFPADRVQLVFEP